MIKITMAKSIQRIAEERAAKRYPNLEVLASYWVGGGGMHKEYQGNPVECPPPGAPRPRLSWADAGGEEGSRTHAQGNGRGEGAALDRGARPEGQVVLDPSFGRGGTFMRAPHVPAAWPSP